MIINGKEIQQHIVHTLQSRIQKKKYVLDIVYIGSSVVIEKYINAKKKLGEVLGVSVVIHRFPETSTLLEVVEKIKEISIGSDGMIIQLPVPAHIPQRELLEAVDPSLDVDLLHSGAYESFVKGYNHRIPPVVRACIYVIETYDIDVHSQKVLILGNGKLVGGPMADWCRKNKIDFLQMTREDFSLERLKEADVIISGMGMPHMITPDMVKEGVIVLDAGTSEDKGSVVGDFHPDVSQKASLFTPVPGGIGPLTVVALFHNLVEPYDV